MSEDPPTLTMDTMVCQIPNQISSETGDETSVLNMDTGQYFSLNESSGEIWTYIAEPQQISDICDFLLEQFDIDRRQCEDDVLSHVAAMLEDQLVEVVGKC